MFINSKSDLNLTYDLLLLLSTIDATTTTPRETQSQGSRVAVRILLVAVRVCARLEDERLKLFYIATL